MKQASYAGVVPYCPGTARVEAGDDYPIESKNSSYHQDQPLAHGSTPAEPGLITSNCRSPCCVCTVTAKLEWPLQMQAWAGSMEILECPVTRNPLSALLAGSDGKASRYGGCQCSCRSCRKVLHAWLSAFGALLRIFCQGLLPYPLTNQGRPARQQETRFTI